MFEQSDTTPIVDLDPLVLRGATIERALAEHGLTLGLEPAVERVRVRGRVITGAHTFTGPERGTLHMQALRGAGIAQIAFRAPRGGWASRTDELGTEARVSFLNEAEMRQRARDPEVVERYRRMGEDLDLALADSLARPTVLNADITPGAKLWHSCTIEYEAKGGVLQIVLVPLTEKRWSPLSRNAAMWVETVNPHELIFHCSEEDAPEPNFEASVFRVTVLGSDAADALASGSLNG